MRAKTLTTLTTLTTPPCHLPALHMSKNRPAASATPAQPATPLAAPAATPSLRRRMACWLYEGTLMFGVIFIAALAFGVLTDSREPMQNRHALQGFLFVVAGLYFAWFWHKGQTLAMKTWHIRVVDHAGRPLRLAHALWRYVLSWIWFAPPMLLGSLLQLHASWILWMMLLWVPLYAQLARLHPQRQFWHDAWAGTQLIHAPPPADTP